ncbi:unnamed protein product [Rotaria sordida]|nr:unnamed protein product [Rotaria sordida]
MPTGHYYTQETKELMLSVIQFIEREKNGPTIPLYNVNDRIMAALQISHGSLVKLKNEMKQLQEEQQKFLDHKLLEQQRQQQPYTLAQKYKTERLRPRSSSPVTTPKKRLFHNDDTWVNCGEEKQAIWIDGYGKGRIRTNQGKGKAPAITIIIDNATWHCELTDDTKPPLRSWRKQMIADWLQDHNISYAKDISKAELLELAFENLSDKKYKVEEEAKQYRINILR